MDSEDGSSGLGGRLRTRVQAIWAGFLEKWLWSGSFHTNTEP